MEMSAIAVWAIPAAFDSLLAACQSFSQEAASVAVTAVWQGAVIACGLTFCLRFAPRVSAAHRFAAWAAGFAALVCIPLLPLLSKFTAGSASVASPGMAEAAGGSWLQVDLRWSLVIAALWAAASTFRAVNLAIHLLRLRKLWKSAIPVETDGNLTRIAVQAAGTRGRRQAQVCTADAIDRPSVIGFFAPRILIPEWLLERLTPGEVEKIVLHEAEHLRRRDDWSNLLQKIALVVFPLNPALLWMERRLCREREMACDEGVIRATHAPRAYAACLASLAERGMQRRTEALELGAWQRRPELANRVHRILRRSHALSPLATGALMGVLGCGLTIGSLELARCPQLVAFVPARSAETAQTSALPQTAQTQPLRVANVAAGNAEAKRSTYGAHAARVSDPQRRVALSVESSMQQAVPASEAAGERLVASVERDSNSPRAVLLKAEMPGADQAAASQVQQWVVLTTWEQVQTTNAKAGFTADYDGADAVTGRVASVQPTSRMIVTRVILRVFPASSFFTQPAVAHVRSGWLVMQL